MTGRHRHHKPGSSTAWATAYDDIPDDQLPVPIPGPQGEAGPQGPAGPEGPAGPAGPTPTLADLGLYGWADGTVHTAPEVVAPPPAGTATQGYGARVTGGTTFRHVTQLSDDGSEGTLRWAAGIAGSHVVFDVSGPITILQNGLFPASHVTIDGLTAPGSGIVLGGGPMFCSGIDDFIIQGLRFRDNTLPATCDSLTIKNGSTDFAIRYCSFDGADDGSLDITLDCADGTVEWCILGPQDAAVEGHTSQVARNTQRVTYHHDLFYEGHTRHPQFGDQDEPHPSLFVGEVIGNLIWAPTQGLYGTVITADSIANVINNYYYLSTTGAGRTIHTEVGGSAYASGNYDRRGEAFSHTSHAQTSVPSYAQVTVEATAQLAALEVLRYAGCRVGGLDTRDQTKVDAILAAQL